MSVDNCLPSIAGLDVRTADRTATCQDCDWTADGTATAPLAAAHAADHPAHTVSLEHTLDFSAHPADADETTPLNVEHSRFDTVTITQVTLSAQCNTDGCNCTFSTYDNPCDAALTHGQRYNHDTHARIFLTLTGGTPPSDTTTDHSEGDREIVASLY